MVVFTPTNGVDHGKQHRVPLARIDRIVEEEKSDVAH
jgi:hypothetical protein